MITGFPGIAMIWVMLALPAAAMDAEPQDAAPLDLRRLWHLERTLADGSGTKLRVPERLDLHDPPRHVSFIRTPGEYDYHGRYPSDREAEELDWYEYSSMTQSVCILPPGWEYEWLIQAAKERFPAIATVVRKLTPEEQAELASLGQRIHAGELALAAAELRFGCSDANAEAWCQIAAAAATLAELYQRWEELERLRS